MEMPNLDKLYQTFLSNERTMAEAFGVSHLYYLKRIHENRTFSRILFYCHFCEILRIDFFFINIFIQQKNL